MGGGSQLLSLSRAGDRPAARDQRRRRLSGHLARSDRSSRSRSRQNPAWSFRRVEQVIDGVIADVSQNPVARRGSRTRQDPADRGSDLRPGQPGDAGALVRRRAHHRPEHRRYPKLAGPHSRRHRRTGARRRAKMARQKPFGDRLSDQGLRRRNARRSVRDLNSGPARSASHPSVVACARCCRWLDAIAGGCKNPASGFARRYRGLVRAGRHRAADRDGICLQRRRRPRTRPTSPASATWSPACSTRAPAISIPRPFMNGSTAAPSN